MDINSILVNRTNTYILRYNRVFEIIPSRQRRPILSLVGLHSQSLSEINSFRPYTFV